MICSWLHDQKMEMSRFCSTSLNIKFLLFYLIYVCKMITTMLVNTPITSHSYVCVCVSVRERWEHSRSILRQFPVCNIVLLMIVLMLYFWSLILILIFLFFRAVPAAYGGSQARDQIRAIAAGLHHNSQQCWILNPLSEAKDQTCILMLVRFLSSEPLWWELKKNFLILIESLRSLWSTLPHFLNLSLWQPPIHPLSMSQLF